MSDPHFNIRYWADRLAECEQKVDKFRKKLYEIPMTPYTTEECIELRYLLMDWSNYSRLMAEEVAKYPKTEEKSFWKKTFS